MKRILLMLLISTVFCLEEYQLDELFPKSHKAIRKDCVIEGEGQVLQFKRDSKPCAYVLEFRKRALDREAKLREAELKNSFTGILQHGVEFDNQVFAMMETVCQKYSGQIEALDRQLTIEKEKLKALQEQDTPKKM